MIQLSIALILFLAPLAFSPGPGNLFFAANGARFGFRGTVAANAGYHLATLVVSVTIGLGFDLIAQDAPQFLRIIRYVGAAYVLVLAWRIARAGILADDAQARRAGFGDGVALLLLNPKAYLIIALMFTQFTGLLDMDQRLFVLWVSVVFTVNNLVAFSLYAAVGDRMTARWRAPETAQGLNVIFAVVLAAVAVWMLRS
jgi:threonine/homoserine/homoserine lactone efflux protein